MKNVFDISFKIPRSISGRVCEALYYDMLWVGLVKEGFIGRKFLWANTEYIYIQYFHIYQYFIYKHIYIYK